MSSHPYIEVRSMKVTHNRKEEVRKELLDEAAKHFAKFGFEGSNINDISQDAGYAKGTIYNYFRSKEELFGTVIEEAAQRAVRRYRAVKPGSDVRECLKSLAQADVSVLREEEAFMKVLAGEAMNPRSENYGEILSHLAPFIEQISDVLQSGLEIGVIRTDRPVPQLSLAFLGILTLMYIQHWKSGGTWPELEEIPELVVTLFLDGAGTGPRNADHQGRL